jgi:predicted AAA+ superfamily ATPase
MLRPAIEWQKQELEITLNEKYIPRLVRTPNLNNKIIKVVIGPRRAGKSFYSQHIISDAGKYGYINLDDERLSGINDYDKLTEELMSVYNKPERILIDEIQNLTHWELWVNRLQRIGLKLVVTGSNAHLLSSELSTHLTGRHEKIIIFPFTFSEYRNASIQNESISEAQTDALLEEYLFHGGFPETVVTAINKKDYVATLFQSSIYKDIIKRNRITSAESIENLGRYLLSNTGSEYSYRSLTRVVGCKSDMTVRKYLRFLEESFIVFSVSRFSYKIREQAAQNKKIFAVDNSLISFVGFNMSPNFGKLAENLVAITLEKKKLNGLINYFFWKNERHEEVDFVCFEKGKISQCIQVCWNMDNPKTENREIRSLLKAGSILGCEELIIITEMDNGNKNVTWSGRNANVTLIPLKKWLLEN